MHASGDDGSHCGSGGGGCCERSEEDASARRCCEGGAQFDRPQTLGNHIALEPVEPLFGVSPSFAGSLVSFDSTRDPVPKAEPLYTLHASLLI